MSFFTTKTKVVEIDAENSVTIKELTFGEMQASVKMVVGEDGKATAEQDTNAMFAKSIESWDGPGFEGRPVTPENIQALPARVANKVMKELTPFLSLTDEEKN